MKTPKSLCIEIDANKVPPENVLIYWPDAIEEKQIEWKVGVMVPSMDINQIVLATKGPKSWLWVCPSCGVLRKRLFLPPYGRHFACKTCWNIGDDAPVIVEKSETNLMTKLLKKLLEVMK